MYAIISNGGKQYKVCVGKIVLLEKLNAQIGEKIIFKNVIMHVGKKNINFGNPFLKNVFIHGNILEHGRLKKIHIIKFNRRKHYKKQQGHRQWFTTIKINKIEYKH
ncbi:50S ribosomal protein L21 [Buchnera aphidicola]|uniref:Large ribosomal subunit protein bL21 n=1 Tax=Buchnera aphidicola (Anoecia oenotherae) TaxID=1241833 RepID=A0A4D6XY68_9GAMM|nr:50S ribosomal protein L21 [Buchnera aphidicola]QCI19424.1 50S ribosomal protein L21 [Buchnera aphidicola (Anoecia oenotherae)]